MFPLVDPITPVITPVKESTVALTGLELVHLPPVVLSVKVVVEPTHTVLVPCIAGTVGIAKTVTDVETTLVQPPVPVEE